MKYSIKVERADGSVGNAGDYDSVDHKHAVGEMYQVLCGKIGDAPIAKIIVTDQDGVKKSFDPW